LFGVKQAIRVGYYPMAARAKRRAAKVEPLEDKDFAALEEEDESSAEELHELIEREKNDSSAWINTSSGVV
jgi:hypothetical protein